MRTQDEHKLAYQVNSKKKNVLYLTDSTSVGIQLDVFICSYSPKTSHSKSRRTKQRDRTHTASR